MSSPRIIDAWTMTDYFNDKESVKEFTAKHNYKGRPYGVLPPFQVTWKDLTYKVPTKLLQQKKTILYNVSGFFRSNQITAVMGPSGSGKSSLLGCISGQKKTGVSGSITISTKNRVKFAFVAQDDYLLKRLTIRESLMYASKLKNGGRVDHEVIVDNVLKNLRIQECADIRPKRCSGGQKKRISIALELVSKPNILILDEPTSGLDTASTWHLITTLIQLTQQTEPVAVVATIHQPSAKLFNLFNAVYVMSYDGQCIFHGSPQKLLPYLTKYGLNCPKFHSPSDFVIEIAAKDHGIAKVMMLSTIMKIEALENSHYKEYSNPMNVKHKHRTLNHIFTLSMRNLKLTIRDPFMVPIRVIGHIACAGLMSLLYGSDIGKLSGCPEDITQANNQTYAQNYNRISDKVYENISCMFFGVMLFWFLAVFPLLLVFPLEMNVFFKEYANGWYSCYSYYISKVISDIPFQLIIPPLLAIPLYILTGQYSEEEWRIYNVTFISILVAMSASSQGLLISAWLMKYPTAAVFIGCCTAFPMMLFSGFMIPISEMPEYFQWFTFGNYIRFGLESCIAAIYGFDRCLEGSTSKVTKIDWSQAIGKRAMDKMSNSSVINVNTLVSTLSYFSGEASIQTKPIAMNVLNIDNNDMYKGIAILILIIGGNRIFTYLFLYRKVRALN